MWKGIGKIVRVLALIGALVGIGSGPVMASAQGKQEQVTKKAPPLYLEHSAHSSNSSTLLADHYSHSSHASHASHQSGY
jgi:hypothetical protein